MSAPQPLQHRVPPGRTKCHRGGVRAKAGRGATPHPPTEHPRASCCPGVPADCPCPRALLSPTARRSLSSCPRTRHSVRGRTLTHAGGPAGRSEEVVRDRAAQPGGVRDSGWGASDTLRRNKQARRHLSPHPTRAAASGTVRGVPARPAGRSVPPRRSPVPALRCRSVPLCSAGAPPPAVARGRGCPGCPPLGSSRAASPPPAPRPGGTPPALALPAAASSQGRLGLRSRRSRGTGTEGGGKAVAGLAGGGSTLECPPLGAEPLFPPSGTIRPSPDPFVPIRRLPACPCPPPSTQWSMDSPAGRDAGPKEQGIA